MAACPLVTCGGPLAAAGNLRRPFLLFEGFGHVVTFWSPVHLAMGFDYACACSSLATLKNHVERHGPGVEEVVSGVSRGRRFGHVRGRRPLGLSAGQDFDGVGPGKSGRRDHEARGSDLYGCVVSLWSDGGNVMSGQSGPGCDVSTDGDGEERAERRKRAVRSSGREVCRICWGRRWHWGDLDSACVELLGQEQDQDQRTGSRQQRQAK